MSAAAMSGGKKRVGLFARIGDGLIRVYQTCISPLFPSHCRFYPCCSAYAREAIRRFGLVRGSWLGLRRLLRCHPFCKGGVDPVPDEFRWIHPTPGTIHHKEEV